MSLVIFSKKEAWGKGYATEISIGQIEMLQNSFDNASIIEPKL